MAYPTKEATAGARPVPKSPRSTVASAVEAFQQQQVCPSSQPSAVYAAQQPRFQKSDFIGVFWDGQHWRAEVVDHRGRTPDATKMSTTRKAADTKPQLVGYFEEEIDAAKAVDRASTELMIERVDHRCGRGVSGAKRKLNFPSRRIRHESEGSKRRVRNHVSSFFPD